MKRKRYSPEEKESIIQEQRRTQMPVGTIARKYDIDNETLRYWIYKYDTFGIKGLSSYSKRKKYSLELKEKAIKEYLSGKYSIREVIQQYKISSDSVLRGWIKVYNEHNQVVPEPKGLKYTMIKSKDIPPKKRLEIVLFYIEHNNNYRLTAEKYQVTYDQVYDWVKRFEKYGEDGLAQKIGRKKTKEPITQTQVLQEQIKKIEAENMRLKAENLYLKKLNELEGR